MYDEPICGEARVGIPCLWDATHQSGEGFQLPDSTDQDKQAITVHPFALTVFFRLERSSSCGFRGAYVDAMN